MALSFPGNGNSTEVVGQVGRGTLWVRRVGNPPGTARTQAAGAGWKPARRIQSCPTIHAGCSIPGKPSGIGLRVCATSVAGKLFLSGSLTFVPLCREVGVHGAWNPRQCPPDSLQGDGVVRERLKARRSLKFQVIFRRIVVVANEVLSQDASAGATLAASWSKVTIS